MARQAVVIGAGHNGLVCSTILAMAGFKVLLLERRDMTGGLCAGEEFHPGYRHAGLVHDTSGVRPWIVSDLELKKHGLAFDAKWPKTVSLADDGETICFSRDPKQGPEDIKSFSQRDATSYSDYLSFLDRVRGVIEPLLNEPPADLLSTGVSDLLSLLRHGWAARRLGKKHMMELLRIPPMCVADWLREWFENDRLNAVLALPAVAGTWMGPWSPGSAANLLLHEATLRKPVTGGAAAYVRALEASARKAGVDIRTGSEVTGLVIEGGVVKGVQLGEDETIDADTVVSSCDPKRTFLDWIPVQHVSHSFERCVRNYRMRGTTAKVHLALSGSLEWKGNRGRNAHYARTGNDLDFVERAFDAVKYRQCSERPVLDLFIPSRAEPDLAPAGHEVVSIMVHYAPYQLEGGWNEAAREALGDTVVTELERYAPGLRDLIVAKEVLTPADIESRYGVTGGHIHHGEHALDQLITRPTPETAQYDSPFGGLFCCGGSCHPGGGVSGVPGALAARAILSQ